METLVDRLKKLRDYILYPSSLYFAIILFVFYVIGSASMAGDVALPLKQIWLLFLFALCLALCNLLFKIKSLNMIIKVALHFTGTIFAFVVLLVVMSDHFANTGGGVFATIAVAFIYAIIAGIILGVRAIFKRSANEKDEYSSKFSKKDK